MGATMGGCSEVAELLGVTPGRIRKLCQQGRIVGAEQLAQGWIIPLPPRVIPPAPSKRRAGIIEQSDKLPDFLERRLPRQGKANP